MEIVPIESVIKDIPAEQVNKALSQDGYLNLMEHPECHLYADFAFEQAEKDKFRVLNQAETQHTLVSRPHLPFPGAGRVTPLGVEWRWQPVV